MSQMRDSLRCNVDIDALAIMVLSSFQLCPKRLMPQKTALSSVISKGYRRRQAMIALVSQRQMPKSPGRLTRWQYRAATLGQAIIRHFVMNFRITDKRALLLPITFRLYC